MTPLINIAIKAARAAGDIIVRGMPRIESLQIEEKRRNDYVTQIDRKAEERIREIVQEAYPDHGFHGEEYGHSGGDEVVWLVDPLDGTTNYLHGFPSFCVSIAVQERGILTHGVVYDPIRQELFTAARGKGAQLDGRKIRVSNGRGLSGSLIGTGMPYLDEEAWHEHYWEMLRAVAGIASGVRRPGAAALDLAYVAAGRLDGFWELGLQPWDMAAGTVLIREAGGLVADLEGGEDFLSNGRIVAGGSKVFKELLKTLRPYVRRMNASN